MMMDIRDRRCLVVGGGTVALRKVLGLLGAGAKVVVVSPELHPELQVLKEQGRIEHRHRSYRPEDLEAVVVGFAATDNPAVNTSVCQEARRRGIPVNSATRPDEGTFTVPAMIHRGDLTIAISTGGVSPALAQRLRQDLEVHLGEEYAEFLHLLEAIRPEVLRAIPTQEGRQTVFERLVHSDLLTLLRRGEREAARVRVAALLQEAGISVESSALTADRARGSQPSAVGDELPGELGSVNHEP